MASAPPATAAVVVDHPKHDLHPVQVKTSSPRFPPPAGTPTSSTVSSPFHRRIGIAVDLSEESAYAVKWAVDNYLRFGDAVILLHVLSLPPSSMARTGAPPPHHPHL
ncbi:UNVERIFIED_CONTAM: Universal stress protein PHOS34 [Sesamum radiatum]|uniref:Universal stress protein PHOS34 n=1 Tax=Sesamum radiatum TaxID=300843 RepID=A0AAW2T5F8_SESRA